jgi:hypothetical protein
MDVLDRNGTIDYIPYDLMGSQGGVLLYNNQPPVRVPQNTYNGPVRYGVSQDCYAPAPPVGSVALNNVGITVNDNEVKQVRDYRNSLKKGSETKTNVFKNKKQLWKGLASIGLLAGTVALLICGRKKAPSSGERSRTLLSKLNPFNWFKKSK